MATTEEITDSIEKLSEICKVVVNYTSSERMSLRMIRDDVTHHRLILSRMQQEIRELEKRKEDLALELEQSKDESVRESNEIVKIARENLAFASMDREKARKELEDAEQAKYLADKELDRVTA